MSLPYEAVDTVDLDNLEPNKSVRITAILGSFRRRTYQVDVFESDDDHVFGIAFVYDNIEENEMLGDPPATDPDSLEEVYVRFPRHGQLANGRLEFDTLSEEALAGRGIKEVSGPEWGRTTLAAAALGYFELTQP